MKMRTAATFFVAALHCPAARLSPPAERAFTTYITNLEERLAGQHAGRDLYLAVLNGDAATRSDRERQLLSGGVRIEPVNGGTWEVSGGLMHHWRAATFVPGADAGQMLALLRDPNHLSRYYAPEVVSSHTVTADGKRMSLIRFKKRKVVTVVLDAEFEGYNELTGDGRGYSFSRSTHIWQVDEPGTANEHRRPEGDDDGYLWRLNSYWSFVETQTGLLIECEAVSLTRKIPLGLGWLITPIIQTLPKESLQFTLQATKNALMACARKETRDDPAN
ncbi:MAG TPA: hypothetical protein VGV35_08135 [Bryobacteraceae bacterium]|nr:hypothetical protein [Bryobacteraceae bacterium]